MRRHVVSRGTTRPAVWTGVVDGDRHCVDGGRHPDIGGADDRHSDLSGSADGVGDEVAGWVRCGDLVPSDEGMVAPIMYRPGSLHVVPQRAAHFSCLHTPNCEEPLNLSRDLDQNVRI